MAGLDFAGKRAVHARHITVPVRPLVSDKAWNLPSGKQYCRSDGLKASDLRTINSSKITDIPPARESDPGL